MAFELHPKEALITAAIATRRPVAFLVGAPLSLKDGIGVPGVAQMLDFVRAEIRDRVAFALPDFESALSKTSDADDYQAAMRWLGVNAGQDAINAVIETAVLCARKANTPKEFAHNGQPADWDIPTGTAGLGDLVARGGERFPGPILTTNFDPLISLAIRNAGGHSGRRVITADGTLASSVEDDICTIVHLHGFWRDSDTLHTQAQLTNPRPRLKASLQRLLQQRTLIVTAYGGWDDVFTKALVDLMSDEQAPLDVMWCFFESTHAEAEARFGKLLTAVSPAILVNRFRAFGGIDCHRIFADVLSTLRRMSPASATVAITSQLDLQRSRIQHQINLGLAEIPEQRRRFAQIALERLMKQFYGESEEKVEAVASVVLDVFQKDEHWKVLKGIDENEEDDVKTFASALEIFGLLDMVLLANRGKSRIKVLDHLDDLVSNPATLEKNIHSVIERNLWVLGYDHSLIASNKTLAKTIGEYTAAKFAGDRASKRPDLFLAQNLQGGYLLIEFKRPSKEIDRQDQRQAQEYRDELEPKFGKIEILLLGKGRDPSALIQNDPPRLQVFGYEAVISAARTQLDWLLAELRDSEAGSP